MYAVIEDSGTQIKVSEGDIIKIDTRELAEDAATVTFDRVLLVGEADILEEGKDTKVEIWKKRRRKGYVRHNGHRQGFVRVKVTDIKG